MYIRTNIFSPGHFIETPSPERNEEPMDDRKSVDTSHLPAIDVSPKTHTACVIAVVSGTVILVLCVDISVYIIAKNPDTHLAALRLAPGSAVGGVSTASVALDVILLVINVILTLVTDSVAFVHAVSLRWALFDEGRLHFNTNIRLFTSSRHSRPNQWWVNALSLASLILCYGSTSILFLMPGETYGPITHFFGPISKVQVALVNPVALIGLAIGIAVQVAIAAWILASRRRVNKFGHTSIPTWSSNPLNSALAAMQRGLIAHRDGRCLCSIHQSGAKDGQNAAKGVYPVAWQRNAWKAHKAVRYVVVLLWSLAVLAAAWPIIVTQLAKGMNLSVDRHKSQWSWESTSYNSVRLAMTPAENDSRTSDTVFSYETEMVLALFFITLVQAIQTTGLHCAELFVNLSRDEEAWREATKKKGATYRSVSLYTAATSWSNVILFVAKAVLHWIIGQSVLPQVVMEDQGIDVPTKKFGIGVTMIGSRLVIYAVCAAFMALFTTFLALRKPKGPQPVAWDHLQTIADLIDDWDASKDGKMWWGDKTNRPDPRAEIEPIRHAGTSSERERVGQICMTSKYAG
ncbi:hypothetical protein GQ53DRAFT_852497 [Thozetella sp. PMI_491]|nr:hypothetical protein GQ53DRAFT_852497 [Thozetella sp. PMI_491]